MTTKQQLLKLAEQFRERAAIVYAKAATVAPIQGKELQRAFEWCAEDLEELAKGME